MLKDIIIDRHAMPEVLGYPDKITVIGDDSLILYHDVCRSGPNPFRPSDRKPWRDVYALVAPGELTWEWYDSPSRGPCLLLNNGGKIPTVNPNFNHDNLNVASWVEIHAGQASGWPGSTACVTIPLVGWSAFIGLFAAGDKGKLRIVDKMGVAA